MIVVFYWTLYGRTVPTTPMNNLAWLVSHAHLAFTPDVYFIKGQWEPSALNTGEGAARYLRFLPFVADQRLGATGHSNSGRYGYYVLTHSQAFAAMAVGSGTTNIISMALSLDNAQASRLARGLEKKVWWLQYDEGKHTTWGRDGRDAEDFAVRYTLFFDHYLKGTPPPKWITERIPARFKGVETGPELDSSGRVP